MSNIYLHEVLDGWFERTIKPGWRGRAELIRLADDFVVVCAKREDAEALLAQVIERFQSYGLTIHPEKTRMVDCRHPWNSDQKPQTFDFLGFTHYWGTTLRGGYASGLSPLGAPAQTRHSSAPGIVTPMPGPA